MEIVPDEVAERRFLMLACGAALGGGMGYFLDPIAGAGRRARFRDKTFHAIREAGEGLDRVASDLVGRGHGLAPWLRHRLGKERVDDGMLLERVRSKLGHYASHPRALEVEVRDGIVTLSGPLAVGEIRDLISHLRRIPGVAEVRNHMESHSVNGHDFTDAKGLNGFLHLSDPLSAATHGMRDARWTPAIRFAAACMGISLALAGMRKRGGLGGLWWAAGLGLILRGAANRPLRTFFGIGAGRETIHLQKTIKIDAPLARVFAIWTRYGDYPDCMPHVVSVTELGEGRWRWKIRAVPGVIVEWVAEITRSIPEESISWRSLPGTLVPNSGTVRFKPNATGGTAVDIRLGYQPPAGALGHALAKLMGADPKRILDRDFGLLKSSIEREAAGATESGRRG